MDHTKRTEGAVRCWGMQTVVFLCGSCLSLREQAFVMCESMNFFYLRMHLDM